jgi:hypothetical protein
MTKEKEDAPLSDEEFEALRAKLAKEEQRRQAEAQANYEKWLRPIQEFVYGEDVTALTKKAEKILSDPMTAEQRNVRMALDAFYRAAENLRLNIPPAA